MSDFTYEFRKKWGLYLDSYDSGSEDLTESFLAEKVVMDNSLISLLLYPDTDSLIILNGSDKEIFLPADTWTPLGFKVDSFNIKAITGTGKLYWQGWY